MAGMKAHTEYLTITTDARYEMVHLTSQVEEIVRRSGIEDGLCFVSPMHITAAIYVNDNEDGLIEDIGTWLEKLAPAWPGYKHHRTGEDNADAHLKALLLHHETTLPVDEGTAGFGDVAEDLLCGVRWAAVEARYCEAAGRRKRMMSTRRFWVRPSSVALLATG